MKATWKKTERKMKGRKESGEVNKKPPPKIDSRPRSDQDEQSIPIYLKIFGDGPNLGRRNYFEAPFRFQFFASFQNFHEF